MRKVCLENHRMEGQVNIRGSFCAGLDCLRKQGASLCEKKEWEKGKKEFLFSFRLFT